MKCQKCGKNEVSFHYSSNINGSVAETYLCSECAAESGYDIANMLDLSSLFGSSQLVDFMLPMHRGSGGFMQLTIPMMQKSAMFPFTLRPGVGMIGQKSACSCCSENGAVSKSNTEIDKEMSKRRELNALMRIAVENEEFEKAAILRDQIKELESKTAPEPTNGPEVGRKLKCDSERTSQDSPPVQ